MNGLLILFDVVAGLILTAHAFCAIVHMGYATRHAIRLSYIVLAVGALGMLVSPAMDADWRHLAHVAVIMAYAALVIFDQRKRQVISLGS